MDDWVDDRGIEDGNCLREHKNKQQYKKINWKSKTLMGYLSSQYLKGFWNNGWSYLL